MTAIATAEINWTSGTLAASVAIIFICSERVFSLMALKRRASSGCPPNALTTRWASIASWATWVNAPTRSWMRRLWRRKRLVAYLTAPAIRGPITRKIAESAAFR